MPTDPRPTPAAGTGGAVKHHDIRELFDIAVAGDRLARRTGNSFMLGLDKVAAFCGCPLSKAVTIRGKIARAMDGAEAAIEAALADAPQPAAPAPELPVRSGGSPALDVLAKRTTWRPMSEEPIDRPITACKRLDDGSWWYARVKAWRYEDGEGGRFGDHGYELLHYNGDVTMGRFFPGSPEFHADARWVVEAWDLDLGKTVCIDLAKLHSVNDRTAQVQP